MTVRSLFWILLLAIAVTFLSPPATRAEQPTRELESQLSELQSRVRQAESNQRFVMQGREGWLFFVPEVRSILAGRFWGEDAVVVSRATRPEHADPLPAIVDFHQQLRKAGIDLLVVPVPAKAAVVPEMLLENGDSIPKGWRMDAGHAEFLCELTRAGVPVVDLAPLLRKAGENTQRTELPVYCRTDSHWSGVGVQIAADEIARHVKSLDWYDSQGDQNWNLQMQTIEIQGDLTKMLDVTNQKSEPVEIVLVRDQQGHPIPTSKESEILLLGDSHTLVFHDPSLFALGAGLPDHLAFKLGRPVDLIGVRGSGATAARITLARQKGGLQGKRLVVWCFAAREFTEAADGWRKLPIPGFDPKS